MPDGLSAFDTAPRMRETMTAADLNLDGCIELASAILREAASDYTEARRALNRNPFDQDARHHFYECRRFYNSDYFKALSGGLVDGKAVMEDLDKRV